MKTLEDRMSAYEKAQSLRHTPGLPIIIRVDGRSFSTYTKHMTKPFDTAFAAAMVYACESVLADMGGNGIAAFTQSDEATFVLRDDGTEDQQQWFGGVHDKLVSVTASAFTYHFCHHLAVRGGPPAIFDARAFTVPVHEIPNVLLHRMFDCNSNAISAAARVLMSQSQVHGLRRDDLLEALTVRGYNFYTEATPEQRNGTLVVPPYPNSSGTWAYYALEAYLAQAAVKRSDEHLAKGKA